MKKILVFAMLLIISVTSFSQPTTAASPAVKTDYQQKSKHQRNAANAMLYGGVSIVLVGGLIQNPIPGNISFNTGRKKPSVASKILLWTGIASIAGSIPLFMAYHRNKKKGMSLSLKNVLAPQISNNNFAYRQIPSLTLKIPL